MLRSISLSRFRNEKSSEVDFGSKDLCSLLELEGLESSNRSEIFTSSEGIVDAQHTRKSASPDQNSSQGSSKCNFFASDYTDIGKSAYALRISTLKSLTYLNKIPDAVKNICVALSP